MVDVHGFPRLSLMVIVLLEDVFKTQQVSLIESAVAVPRYNKDQGTKSTGLCDPKGRCPSAV